MVCFSDELAAGSSRPLKYFGRDLAAYRGEDGVVRVLDAWCPHMGAHVGVNGKVKGDCLACPFHGWTFGPDGDCVEIPYARKIPPKARLSAWPVAELNGVVLVWHDPAGGPPDFTIPRIEELGSPEWLPWQTSRYHIKTHPREIVDNLADKAHFPAVHQTAIDDFGFEVDGHTATQRVRGRAFLANGGVDHFSSRTTYHGPGYLLMRMDGAFSNYMLFAHTPVDESHLDLWMAVTLKIAGSREKTESYVGLYLDNLKRGFEDDIRIWENKIYREPAMLCDGDGPIGRLRRWYRQFYEPRPAALEHVSVSALPAD
jgi:3-ketosteroid 9alpha-monooxygenase subunit A